MKLKMKMSSVKTEQRISDIKKPLNRAKDETRMKTISVIVSTEKVERK